MPYATLRSKPATGGRHGVQYMQYRQLSISMRKLFCTKRPPWGSNWPSKSCWQPRCSKTSTRFGWEAFNPTPVSWLIDGLSAGWEVVRGHRILQVYGSGEQPGPRGGWITLC